MLKAHDAQIREKDKAARDLEAQAAEIDAVVFDLKAVNANTVQKVDKRSPQQIIEAIQAQSKIVNDALNRLNGLMVRVPARQEEAKGMSDGPTQGPSAEVTA